MTLHLLERPETTPELAAWLERHLVGHTLGELIAESSAVADAQRREPPLAELIDLDSVLRRGLGCLSAGDLHRLFQNPTRLFELQERIFIDGGEYWDHVARSREINEASDRVLQRLQSFPLAAPRQKLASFFRPSIPSLAALFLIGLTIGWLIPRGTGAPGMAWTRPGAFRPSKSRQEFLNRLAMLANEWFDKKPPSPDLLAAKIIEFRHGCTLLQLHAQEIPELDRKWLLEACRNWSNKLDQQLVQVEDFANGKSERSFEEILAETDDIIQKLITRLKTEANA